VKKVKPDDVEWIGYKHHRVVHALNGMATASVNDALSAGFHTYDGAAADC
jgi:hypothetical protein